MLWKARRRQPDLYVKIDEEDLKGFEDCVTYLKVVPEVMIRRPPPIAPSQEYLQWGKRRRSQPGRRSGGGLCRCNAGRKRHPDAIADREHEEDFQA